MAEGRRDAADKKRDAEIAGREREIKGRAENVRTIVTHRANIRKHAEALKGIVHKL